MRGGWLEGSLDAPLLVSGQGRVYRLAPDGRIAWQQAGCGNLHRAYLLGDGSLLYSNGALMLIMNGEMNVIDLDEAASMPLMYIPGFLAWSNESDTFMILNTKSVDAEGHQSTPEMSFYLYRHLTPDELLDKGTQQLEEMSQE